MDETRTEIKTFSADFGSVITDEHLEDRRLIRRIVLKRMVYGVDINPMSIELAKVSLWLHTFTVGAPLSFLDHHLRPGNSVFGPRLARLEHDIRDRMGPAFNSLISDASLAVANMRTIEESADSDISQVRASSAAFQSLQEHSARLAHLAALFEALRWKKLSKVMSGLLNDVLLGRYGDTFDVLTNPTKYFGVTVRNALPKIEKRKDEEMRLNLEKFETVLLESAILVRDERFMCWDLAFPGVFANAIGNIATAVGVSPTVSLRDDGFDFVIGNPAWERLKLQKKDYFLGRDPDVAQAASDAIREHMIAELRQTNPRLFHQYAEAHARAEMSYDAVIADKTYELLASDPNYYALMFERSMDLSAPDGSVGLIVPTTIVTDKNKARFVKATLGNGRLKTLYDFENNRGTRDVFFDSVDTRFKFCLLIVGPLGGPDDGADCAFFLRSVADLEKPGRRLQLTHADFKKVNPETGTAPIFRSAEDVALTFATYRQVPTTLKSGGWAMKFMQMINLTTKSSLFKNAKQLESIKAVNQPNRRKRAGGATWLPLYEGKMVSMYDHRAASVIINAENRKRQAQKEEPTAKEKENVKWLPEPRFWIKESDVSEPMSIELPDNTRLEYPLKWVLAIKDVTSSTNQRTMMSMIVPLTGCGHTLPVFLPMFPKTASSSKIPKSAELSARAMRNAYKKSVAEYEANAPLLMALFNSVPYDYIARQKVSGNHMTKSLAEQVALPTPKAFERMIGDISIGGYVRERVGRLSYTSTHLAEFASSCNLVDGPFIWDQEERLRLQAEIDAAVMMLYGWSEADLAQAMTLFSGWEKQQTKQYGSFVSREMIVGAFRLISQGDLKYRVGKPVRLDRAA